MLSTLKERLARLFMPAKVRHSLDLLQMINSYRMTQLIYVSAKLGIADLLKDGPRHSDELAKLVGADQRSLYRLLRALASVGIFSEIQPDYFTLTPCGELLRTDIQGSMRAVALMNGEPWTWRTWESFLDTIKTGDPQFARVFGSSFYEYLEHQEDAKDIFDSAMTNFSELQDSTLVTGYDFSSIRCLVDIGGGRGKLITSILTANPNLKGILFDLPRVIQDAKQYIAATGLTERCQLIGGSFLDSIPRGGDTYLLKSTIHMFENEPAIKILKNCREVMPINGKLLLLEMVIPPKDEPSVSKILDLQMLIQIGGCERTKEEYQALLEAAGFQLNRIVSTHSPMSIIEATLV
jgi:hypothetical protein